MVRRLCKPLTFPLLVLIFSMFFHSCFALKSKSILVDAASEANMPDQPPPPYVSGEIEIIVIVTTTTTAAACGLQEIFRWQNKPLTFPLFLLNYMNQN